MNTLKKGDSLPNFECLNDKGNLVKSNDYKGKKLIVFFYPKASTPGCTAEACNLRDNYKVLQDKGFELLDEDYDEIISGHGRPRWRSAMVPFLELSIARAPSPANFETRWRDEREMRRVFKAVP